MKRILLSLMMVVATLASATAAEVSFNFQDPTTLGYASPAIGGGESAAVKVDETKGITSGIIQIDVANNNASTPTRFWGGTKFVDLRAYKTATFTIKATNGDNITTLEFAGSKIGDAKLGPFFSFEDGSYEGDVKVGTWTGSANTVVVTITGTINLNTLVVTTVTASGVATPSFSPAGGKFYEAQEVTLTCPTEGAAIYYTTDGTTPSAASTMYTAPISVSKIGDTVIKAIAIKEVSSDVVSATYTIANAPTVANIAAFLATNTTGTPNGEIVEISSPVTVLYHGISKANSYLFVKDETSALQVFSAGKTFTETYETGDVIPAGVSGSVGFYGKTPQMVPNLDSFVASTSKVETKPMVTSVEEVSLDMLNQLILIKNATIDAGAKTVNDETGAIAFYNRFDGIVIPTEAVKYDVTAIANSFNGALQIFPIKFDEASGVSDATADATTIVAKGGNINISVANNATAIIVNAAGQVVAQKAIVAGENTIEVAGGFYIVKVGNTVAKVIVK